MKIMVSACLLGDNVKYDGTNNKNNELINFLKDYEVIKVCPECLGGLTIPRSPSEIKDDKVISKEGIDVTKEFMLGANKTGTNHYLHSLTPVLVLIHYLS